MAVAETNPARPECRTDGRSTERVVSQRDDGLAVRQNYHEDDLARSRTDIIIFLVNRYSGGISIRGVE